MFPRPSFITGYAAGDCESLYPELWVGLIGLWAPGLGCQSFNNGNATVAGVGGVQVQDMSGYNRTAYADGNPENRFSVFGGPALESLDTAFSGLRVDDDTPRMMEVTDGFTIVFHHEKTDATLRRHDAFVFGSSGGIVRVILPNAGDNLIYWDYGGTAGSNRLTVATPMMGSDVWVFRAGRSGLSIWQNGQKIAESTTAVTRTSGSGSVGMKGSGTNCDLCRCEFFYLYNRELSDLEIQTVSNVRLAPLYLHRPLMVTPGVGTTAENELAFSDAAEAFLFIGDVHHVAHELGLTDSAVGDNASVEEAGSTLAFTQTVSVLGPIYVSVHEQLNLSDGTTSALGVPWLPIAVFDTLAFVQKVGRVFPRSVTSVMAFTQEGHRGFQVIDTLNLTQVIEYGKGADPSHDHLAFTQTVLLNAIYRRSISHSNFIRDSFTYYSDSPCGRKSYSPFEGGEASMPGQRLQFKSQFTLENLTGPYVSVVLRNPETDNRDRLGFNRVNRETSGGELNVFVDPVWAKVNTLLFTFTAIKSEKIDAVQSFLLETLGQEIKITDWTGTQWRGVITTPNEVVTEDADGYWTLSFEFEGEPYDGTAPDDRLAFTQTVEVSVESPP